MPIPLNSRGSVRARFSVWLSRDSAARNEAVSASSTSRPRLSCSASAASPRTRWSEARFFPLASRHQQGPGREVERRQRDLPGRPRSPAPPAEAAGDHQVEDQKQIAFQTPHDPFAEAAEVDHPPARRRCDRRIDGAQQKGAGEADGLQRLSHDARPQGLDVDHDVRKLGHAKSDSMPDIAPAPQPAKWPEWKPAIPPFTVGGSEEVPEQWRNGRHCATERSSDADRLRVVPCPGSRPGVAGRSAGTGAGGG